MKNSKITPTQNQPEPEKQFYIPNTLNPGTKVLLVLTFVFAVVTTVVTIPMLTV